MNVHVDVCLQAVIHAIYFNHNRHFQKYAWHAHALFPGYILAPLNAHFTYNTISMEQ